MSNKMLWLVIAGVALVVVINQTSESRNLAEEQGESYFDSGSWQESYRQSAEFSLPNYDSYVQGTTYYDLESQQVYNAAAEIASRTTTAKQAIEETLEYVYQRVRYLPNEPDGACYNAVASSILASGKGQCDTQSIAVIAILRQMDIASVPVGGCIYLKDKCVLTQSLAQSLEELGIGRTPKYKIIEDVDLSTEDYGRTANVGGLHAYVYAWVPNEGWLTLEATTGRIANTKCYEYHVEVFPNNNELDKVCVSNNFLYANACANGNLQSLNTEGVGLAGEVYPSW